ncbi:nucleotidyltransferase family protein [Salinicola sp. LHM]|uniref:nucleotidyltransferase family protein n=1 Tax=Salinicola sp. LHM TaxID=3065298 RepID=UPI002ACE33C5|nr:nucleotidyltransferase family protein [Salinicola sp. LHM]WQH32660.1 nucleotidyltransferase family protein [Salinicola sp. LHM]
MEDAEQIGEWIRDDAWRMEALRQARSLCLPDWWLAAGFVRNLVWDRLHGYSPSTPLNDIDLIYFDPAHAGKRADRKYEQRLQRASTLPWSVKNQARMHERHGHRPYESIEEALSVWVERETAVGVTLGDDDCLRLIAPFGVASLLAGRVTHNPRHGDREEFRRRVAAKGWQRRWPKLDIPEL